MTFVRFVVPSVTDEDSQTAIGVVAFAYRLMDSAPTSELAVALTWFENNLDVPDRFNRTKSKGWYRRQTRGISWLRASATEHVDAMTRLAYIVESLGYATARITTERPGYVTYEDDVQVVAEPFRDTPTT